MPEDKGIFSENSSDSKSIDPSKCSRERSREVRSYLQQYIYPFVLDKDPKNFPSQCHLNPLFDMYYDHEAHKTKVSNRIWTCQYCKKQFNSEYYIDKHMTLKHPDKLLNMTFNTQISSSNCLEDLCPIFGCKPEIPKPDGKDRVTKSHHHYKRTTAGAKGNTGTRFSYKSAKRTSKGFHMCTNIDMERSKYQCEALAMSCFKHDDGIIFKKQVCNAIKCDSGILKGVISFQKQGVFHFWIVQYLFIFMVFGFVAFYVVTSKTIYNVIFARGDQGLMPTSYNNNEDKSLIERWKRFYRSLSNNKTS